ncbi:MAG: YcfL family protein [Burkholderiales bacterium]|nr:YcfL family protein [Burkholderiales bacterium]
MVKNFFMAIAFAAALLLTGCQTLDNDPDFVPVTWQDLSVPRLTIIFANRPVSEAVGIVDPKVDTSRMLELLTLSLKNQTKQPLTVECQAAWTDNTGSALGAPFPPITMNLQPGELGPISVLANSPNAVYVALWIKVVSNEKEFNPGPPPL